MKIERDVPLAPRTTMEVGGRARFFAEAETEDDVREALAWAAERDLPVEVLGGGSNVIVADRGLEALVLRYRAEAIGDRGDGVVEVAAGVSWDALVSWAVERGYAGLECLSGIPGDVGAAPMQNVGAYGQEVAETIERVSTVSRTTGERSSFDARACGFGYRDSVFKGREAGRHVVTEVRFRLRPGGPPTIRYPELERAVRDAGEPDLATVRRTVIALRRNKSMVIDPSDENHRSAGSFFVNPVLDDDGLAVTEERVKAQLGDEVTMPRYPAEGGTKLPAAWLIERAGMTKGTTRGRVGISTKHCLALVNRGGATAGELIAFAAEVRAAVRELFAVALTPEPRLLGFTAEETAALLA
jgi:UDP-N-acetylmuramate dehydrogenase